MKERRASFRRPRLGMPPSLSLNGTSTQRPQLNFQKQTVKDAASQLENTELNDGKDDAVAGENVDTTIANVGASDRGGTNESFESRRLLICVLPLLGEVANPLKELSCVHAFF